MAYKGKQIKNAVTGQQITFLRTASDTNGELLEMESLFQPYSREPAMHYHPFQREQFKVIGGELTVKMNGLTKVLKEGETLHVPANAHHAMWNASALVTVVSWQVIPALQTEYFMETVMGLANEGKTNKEGMPDILQIALIARRFKDVFRLSRPSQRMQKAIFGLLSPLATIAGYKATYKKHLD